MNDNYQYIKSGLKVFFICPDVSVMPKEDFLKTLFSKGFEVYYLFEDAFIDLEQQVDCILNLFDDVMFFFTVSKAININWFNFISKISNKYADIKIGVLYKEYLEYTVKSLEKTYLYDIGIQCGCIALGSYTDNIRKIEKILEANDANKRKVIRMPCCKRFSFDYKDSSFNGKLLDVSITHFSCAFHNSKNNENIDIPENQKVKDINILFGEKSYYIDAILYLKRLDKVNNRIVYVFGFCRKADSKSGLDLEEKSIINSFIYDYYQETVKESLKISFYEKRVKLFKNK